MIKNDFIIKQLDGNNLRIQHNGTTQPNTKSSIGDRGMPIVNSDKRGLLWINFHVRLPEQVPEQVLDMLKDIK